MDYQRIYDQFIVDRLTKQSGLIHHDKHHIVPRSLGGSDDPENIILLDPGEHLFAHIVLARIHGGALSYAAYRMNASKRYAGRRSRSNFAWLRSQHREAVRAASIERSRKPDARQRVAAMSSGRERSAKEREKSSASAKRLWADPEYRARMEIAQKNRWSNPEHRKRHADLQRKKWDDPAFRANNSAGQKARRAKAREEKSSISPCRINP